MGPAAVPIMVGLMAASTVYAGYQRKMAGKAEKYEYEARARQEKLAATDREIARRDRLLKSLAARSAQFSAQGTTFEGSPSALLVNDFREYELERTTAAANLAATTQRLNAAARNAKRAGKMAFTGSLIEAAGIVASGFGGGGKLASINASEATSATRGTAPSAGVRMS